MANCKNCGKELLGGENVCPQCGTPVEGTFAAQQPGVAPQTVNVNGTVSGLPKDNLGLAGFICGIIGALCCTYVAIPGLICSILSLVNIKNGKVDGSKKWMGIVGIICSAIGLLMMVINIIALINGTNQVYNILNS